MLREGCEPLARRGQLGAGHPRSGDAQCAPTPANSLPLVGRLAAPRLAEGCSCDAGFASFVSLFEFLIVVSNSQKKSLIGVLSSWPASVADSAPTTERDL